MERDFARLIRKDYEETMTIAVAIIGFCYLMDAGHPIAAQVLVWSTFAQFAVMVLWTEWANYGNEEDGES